MRKRWKRKKRRGIKSDHEIPDLIAVLILQRLHQRQITVGLQPEAGYEDHGAGSL